MTTTLTARGPEDLLAAVPVVLGFRPRDSLVMLTFDARARFHARVDLPPPAEVEAALPELVDALVSTVPGPRVGRVAFVSYSDDAGPLGRGWRAALRAAFGRAGIGVIDVLRAHAGLVAAGPRPIRRGRETRALAVRRGGAPVRGPGGLRGAGHPSPAARTSATRWRPRPRRWPG